MHIVVEITQMLIDMDDGGFENLGVEVFITARIVIDRFQ